MVADAPPLPLPLPPPPPPPPLAQQPLGAQKQRPEQAEHPQPPCGPPEPSEPLAPEPQQGEQVQRPVNAPVCKGQAPGTMAANSLTFFKNFPYSLPPMHNVAPTQPSRTAPTTQAPSQSQQQPAPTTVQSTTPIPNGNLTLPNLPPFPPLPPIWPPPPPVLSNVPPTRPERASPTGSVRDASGGEDSASPGPDTGNGSGTGARTTRTTQASQARETSPVFLKLAPPPSASATSNTSSGGPGASMGCMTAADPSRPPIPLLSPDKIYAARYRA